MEAYSLYEVNEYIKRVMALNFQEPIWVECEISQIKEVRGQVYMDLIEKAEDSDEVIAQMPAVIWFKQFLFIKKKLGDLVDTILVDGVKVKLKANIEFHEKYGLKLMIEDVDASYSLGQFQLARQKIIERLKKAHLIDQNAFLALPSVIQRIAVISSDKAAGFKDFEKQLEDNPYQYDFDLILFQASMQGMNTERDLVAAIQQINIAEDPFDIIVIVRGGGSKLDLSSFDNYNIAAAVANAKLPVITGIGHEIDETVTDIVAHSVLKTPTAVAHFIVEHNMSTEASLIRLEEMLLSLTRDKLNNLNLQLNSITQQLITLPQHAISTHKSALILLEQSIQNELALTFKNYQSELKFIENTIELLKPENVLEKGYTLVKQNGKYIASNKNLKTQSEFLIVFKDGEKKIVK